MLLEHPGHLRLGTALHSTANFDVLELQPLRSFREASSDEHNSEEIVQIMHAASASQQEPDQAGEEASCRILLLAARASENPNLHAKGKEQSAANGEGRNGASAHANGALHDESSEQSRAQEPAEAAEQVGSEAEEVGPVGVVDWEAVRQQERQRRSMHASTRDSSSSLIADEAGFPSKVWPQRSWNGGGSAAAAQYRAVQPAEDGSEGARDRGRQKEGPVRSRGRFLTQLAALPWSQVRSNNVSSWVVIGLAVLACLFLQAMRKARKPIQRRC